MRHARKWAVQRPGANARSLWLEPLSMAETVNAQDAIDSSRRRMKQCPALREYGNKSSVTRGQKRTLGFVSSSKSAATETSGFGEYRVAAARVGSCLRLGWGSILR